MAKQKLNFGKYAMLKEVTYQFKEEPSWWWTIRPATTVTQITIQNFININRKFYSDVDEDGEPIQVPLPVTRGEIAVYQIAATFGGTNIPLDDDPDKPAIDQHASTTELLQFIQSLPEQLVYELWEAVGEVNPTLGPPRKDPL